MKVGEGSRGMVIKYVIYILSVSTLQLILLEVCWRIILKLFLDWLKKFKWIELVQNRGLWQAYVKSVINFCIP
jgi:hypothetical protein